jgi:transcription elongation factor GreA
MSIELTQEEMDRLQAQLAQLEGPKRAEIVDAIAVARGHGDLSENFEYHAAKNEQGLNERQITLLRAKIESATIIDGSATPAGTIGVGSRVKILDEFGDELDVVISSAGGDGTVSPDSPMGRALYGRGEGDTITVEAPKASWTARVVTVA